MQYDEYKYLDLTTFRTRRTPESTNFYVSAGHPLFNCTTFVEGILPKGPYPPCLRMADRALLAGDPRCDFDNVAGY